MKTQGNTEITMISERTKSHKKWSKIKYLIIVICTKTWKYVNNYLCIKHRSKISPTKCNINNLLIVMHLLIGNQTVNFLLINFWKWQNAFYKLTKHSPQAISVQFNFVYMAFFYSACNFLEGVFLVFNIQVWNLFT